MRVKWCQCQSLHAALIGTCKHHHKILASMFCRNWPDRVALKEHAKCLKRALSVSRVCQHDNMQALELELTASRTENTSLCEELRRAQNAAAETRNARFLSSPGPSGSGGAVRRVLEAEAAAAEAQRALAAARIIGDEAARCPFEPSGSHGTPGMGDAVRWGPRKSEYVQAHHKNDEAAN